MRNASRSPKSAMTAVACALLAASYPSLAVLCASHLVGCVTGVGVETSLESKIAAKHKILVSDLWGGGHRIIFDFNGRKGWIVEPADGVSVAKDRPWVWTMQWMGAFINRTGAPQLVKKGYCHVHLEAFDTRATDAGLKILSDFQSYLVAELGFATKANLIGMSWGGFYSVRYAAAFPTLVGKVYLDAPLMNFDHFGPVGYSERDVLEMKGPWAKETPVGTSWSEDPRMPVTMAEKIVEARIPVYLIYGAEDQIVDPKYNCELFLERFKAAGGTMKVEKRSHFGHHPHGLDAEDVGRLVTFFAE